MSNTARIAKNTLALYFRQILIMLVNLYTVRVVLNTLGVEDYGIYNVIAGVVAMFGFLSGSLESASQRFFAFEIGRRDFERLRQMFSLNLTLYFLIAAAVLVIAETAGLWFVRYKMAVSPEREQAAFWVYETAVVSFLFTIMVMPYIAVIVAHEAMDMYAYLSIVGAVLKLGMTFLLRLFVFDKLILYGILMCGVSAVTMLSYRMICRKKYRECTFSFYWDKESVKEIAGYTGWHILNVLAYLFKKQIIVVLINQFYGAAAATAQGISNMVGNAVSSFSGNFNLALKSQTIKNYAAEQRREMMSLVFGGTKGTYFLMYIFTLPLVLEMPAVLAIWLKEVPEYSVMFTRLTLIDICLTSIILPLDPAIQATGKMRYTFASSVVMLLNFPLSWLALAAGFPPYSVMVVSVMLSALFAIVQIVITRMVLKFFSIRLFFTRVLLPMSAVTLLSALAPFYIRSLGMSPLPGLCLTVLASAVSVCFFMYTIGISRNERAAVNAIIRRAVGRIKDE